MSNGIQAFENQDSTYLMSTSMLAQGTTRDFYSDGKSKYQMGVE